MATIEPVGEGPVDLARGTFQGDAKYKDEVKRMRVGLLAWMGRTGDPLAESYRKHLSDKPL